MTDQPQPPRYLARFHGGPLDGQTFGHPGPWPLPEMVEVSPVSGFPTADPSGHYRKTNQSTLTEDYPNVARGAEYEWVTT